MPSGSEAALLCPDRSTLALKTPEGELLLLDIASGRELLRCPITKKMWIEAVCADNKRAAVWVAGNHVEVWDLTTRKAIHQLRPEASCLGMSPEGRMLAVADTQMSTSMNKDHVQVWDLNRKKEVFRCEAGIAQLCKVAFSLDGRIIAIRDRSTTRLIETATGKERLRVEEGFGWIHPLAFSPNGKMLASGNGDGTVRLWDVRDGKELYLFRGHLAPVNAIAFSPDGGRLVSGSTDTTALVWEIPAACRERKFPLEKLGQQESAKLWGKLVNTEDASVAYAALQRLAGAPKDAVSLCREHLLAQPIPPEQILRGIALLDADDYAVREQATRDLERIGLQANDALENALKGECSPEVRRRIETVREMWEKKQQRLPLVRAVELLEQIGTAEAVDVLRQLARKPGDLGLRDDAQQSLQRLAAKRNTR
jgi:hypothetical protein